MLKSVLTSILAYMGSKYFRKLLYKFVVRPEMIRLSRQLDPHDKTQLDDNLIKLTDKVVEDL